MRSYHLVSAVLLIGAVTACGAQDSSQSQASPTLLDRDLTVSTSQIAEDTRAQAGAETRALPVLSDRPAGAVDAQSWRTLAVRHDDHRLLLAVNMGACDRFLGVVVADTAQQVTVKPVVRRSTAGACVKRLDTVLGYVDFSAPLGARLASPAAP